MVVLDQCWFPDCEELQLCGRTSLVSGNILWRVKSEWDITPKWIRRDVVCIHEQGRREGHIQWGECGEVWNVTTHWGTRGKVCGSSLYILAIFQEIWNYFKIKKLLKNPVKCIVCRTSAPLDSDRRDTWWDLEVNKRLSRRVAKKADRVRDKRARLGPDLVTYQLSDLEEATLPLWASNDSMHLLRVPCDFNKVCDSPL